jgi:hypothetical protein
MEGVPLLVSLVAVVLVLLGCGVAAYRGRKRFIWSGTTFRCRIRTCGDTSRAWPRLRRRWSRPMWAMWVGDVLLVRRGPVVDRALPLRATVSTAGFYRLPANQAKRCGPEPVAVCMKAWDGSRIEVVTDRESRVDLVGPYLIAAVHDLPGAPLPRSQS